MYNKTKYLSIRKIFFIEIGEVWHNTKSQQAEKIPEKLYKLRRISEEKPVLRILEQFTYSGPISM